MQQYMIKIQIHMTIRDKYIIKYTLLLDGFKSESMRAPGRAATCHLADFHETLPV